MSRPADIFFLTNSSIDISKLELWKKKKEDRNWYIIVRNKDGWKEENIKETFLKFKVQTRKGR
jgi:hypothetical protein